MSSTERHQTLREIFEANSYQAKVDRYPFSDDYETRLDIAEALISVKLWLEQQKRENIIDLEFNSSAFINQIFDKLIKEASL